MASPETAIYNPVVPFHMGVSMQPGLMIYVQGMPTGGRFSVNLNTGAGPHDNIALHLNVRFDEGNIIVRNARTNGQWGPEERQLGFFPFAMGQNFETIILCQPHQFKLAVNGRHLLEYQHRLPYQSIKYVQVEGDVALSMIRTDMEFPTKKVPFSAVVPFANIKGHKITIKGVPLNQHPNKFSIDLKTASPNNDIFLHINPRFEEQQIVRNSLLSGAWGSEERQLSIPFPFHPGVPFHVTLPFAHAMMTRLMTFAL